MAFCISTWDIIHDRMRLEQNRIKKMILLYIKIEINDHYNTETRPSLRA